MIFTIQLLLMSFIIGVSQELNNAHSEKDQIVKSIYFGGGSYYVTPHQVKGIAKFFDEIENIENYEVIISGHTDDIGGKEYNEWLSQMRGRSVKGELLKILIPEELISIKNFGQDNPLYDNSRFEGKLRNRRVDIILQPIVF